MNLSFMSYEYLSCTVYETELSCMSLEPLGLELYRVYQFY